MQLKLVNGAVVIEGAQALDGQALTPADFADKPLTVENEPAFYIALGEDGLLARSVSVNAADRKTVAALVGNWIAEGFHPQPVDLKTYAKHLRALVAARKPGKTDAADPAAAATAGEPGNPPAGADNGDI
ncbi:hypothetical protein DIE18_03480 [Burkholderia sp. Bp9125]|nr:hypothetical protein DIE18_03480 [Burkholderia sp. Bp9125]